MSTVNTEGLEAIKASVTSVFYRQPSPGEPPFVKEGDKIKDDTIICLLEIMKCFRSVSAGVNGTVEEILAENGSMVKEGDTLMLIKPEK